MIYTDKTKLAMKICFDVHCGQVDKSGTPYVFHPFHIAEQMKNETTTVVALLHDVVEDSAVTFEDIAKYGFGDIVVDALRLLTRSKDERYFDYIEKIKKNEIAKAVKLADLSHNSDLSRLNEICEKDIARAEKYKRAIEILSEENA